MQGFSVTRSLETNILHGTTVSDILTEENVVLITDDVSKSIYIYKGKNSSLVYNFIANKLAQVIRKAMRGFYTIKILKDDESITKIKEKYLSKEGKVQEIINPNVHLQEDGSYNLDFGNKIQLERDPAWRNRLTVEESSIFKDPKLSASISMVESLPKLEDYSTEMVLIKTSLYTPKKTLKSFLKDRNLDIKFSKIGDLTEGLFFKPGYSTRFVVKKGSIQAIEFLKPISINNLDSQGKIKAPVLFIPRIIHEHSIEEMKKGFFIPEDMPLEELITQVRANLPNFRKDS